MPIFIVLALIAAARSSPAQEINDVYVIHFILDGTNYNAMLRAVSEGKMPTVHQLFFKKGAVFTQAISTFPSTSTCAYQSFISGLLPGHAGIPHLQRFDRQKEKFIDYLSASGHSKINGDLINLNALQNPNVVNLDIPTTIFELLEDHPTMSLYTSIRRGATIALPQRIPLHALWSTYVTEQINNVDSLAYEKIMEIYDQSLPRIPRYALVGLYSSDISGHFFGAHSDEVQEILVQFDFFMRDFLQLLNEKGIGEKTYFIISADHGMHNTENLFRFKEAVGEVGFKVKTKNPRQGDYNLVAADRGVSSTHVYTRRQDNSFKPLMDADELRHFPSKDGRHINLLDFILSLEPTELIAVRDGESSVVIYDRNRNSSRIDCFLINSDQWCSYRVEKGADPLRFKSSRARDLTDGQPHSSQEWKHATSDEYYTDAVIQLGTLFQDGRGGDLFIIPKNEWGFRKIKHATHGSLIADDMHIPLFISGPTVPQGMFRAMRTVDIFPLLLEWFGLHVPQANHDGVNPFKDDEPKNRNWQSLARLEQLITESNIHISKLALRKNKYLLRLAREEAERREILHQGLKRYIDDLRRQLDDEDAPKVAPKAYIEDHLAIAERIEKLTARRKKVMQRIVRLLS